MPETGKKVKRVLIVDDDDALCEVLSHVIAKEGFEVVQAANGKLAKQKILSALPDLIVLDLMLPEVSGVEILRFLQSEGRGEIPVIVITGRYHDADSERELRMERNVVDFFKKPLHYVTLAGRINELINKDGSK